MATIAELVEDRTVDGVFAVARKRRLTTRGGKPYLALELVDPSGRIEGRVWDDVDLLDRRFGEGDAVRVLGRVERFDGRLQLAVRSVETAETDPAMLAPAIRRDRDELEGFLEFLTAEIAHPGLASLVSGVLGDDAVRAGMRSLPAASADGHHGYAGGLLEHTVGVATLALLGVGQPLLPEELDGRVQVPVAGLQRRLAVHHAGAGALAQLHDGLGVGRHQDASASAAAISPSVSASSPSLSSLASVPRPSRMASATREVIRRTARIASSLPGTG